MTDEDDEVVEIHTDGACSGNPGPGGWGAVLVYNGHERTLSGFEPETTNNRMEILAVIRALETLKRACRVRLVTDSQYVQKGIRDWLPGWKARGWKTASGSAVKNRDLWQELEAVAERHTIEWVWVRGHNGDVRNEQADALAREAIEQGRGQ